MKKIMFSDKYGLTKAVLEGRKTMARGLVAGRMTEDDITAYLKGHTEVALETSPYKIGEVVAVAQSYKDILSQEYLEKNVEDEICKLVERGDAGCTNKLFARVRLMPHQIRITNIKVERMQDISSEDCMREGIEFACGRYYVNYTPQTNSRVWLEHDIKSSFASLINKISGKGTWEENPYVFVYSFELVEKGGER